MRYPFGGMIADYVVSSGVDDVVVFEVDAPVKFWTAKSAGTQYTSLVDSLGNEVDVINSDAEGGLPEFYGPEDVVAMWADASDGLLPRRLIWASDTALRVAQNSSAIATLQGVVAGLSETAPVYVYRNDDGSWPIRPVTTKPVWWIETQPTSPAAPLIGTYMIDGVDYYAGQA